MKNKLPVYLDYAATTPIDPRVIEKMLLFMGPASEFGNPSSSHSYGRNAARAIEEARDAVASLINAQASDIIWTSGATEADNLAIKGIAQSYQHKGKHIVTVSTEHEAVLESCRQLEREGFHVTYLTPQNNGLVNIAQLIEALSPETILVSIMHVNNETGVINNLAAISAAVRSRGIIFHVDAAQSAGKIPIDVQQMPVDLMSFSAHKVYGPKGVGALYIRQKPRIQLKPQLQGGGQENGLRSGTLPTHQIVGMGEAFRLAQQEILEESKRIEKLRNKLWQGIKLLGDVTINGETAARAPGILNVAFANVDMTAALPALRHLAISTGSACHAATREPSRVIRAMGLPDASAYGSIRFSLGRFTTEADIEYAILALHEIIPFIRKMR